MATYNFTNGSLAGQVVPPQTEILTTGLTVLRNIVDCTLRNLDASDGDIAKLLNIPAGTIVLECGIRIITADTASSVVDLGVTGVNVDQWGDAITMDATAGSVIGMLAAPLYFAADNTIDLLMTSTVDLTLGKWEVFAVCMQAQNAY